MTVFGVFSSIHYYVATRFTSKITYVGWGSEAVALKGPILFTIYINEISEILSCNVVLYADDTVILHDDTSILQENLNVIVNWCNDNQLTINAKKSQ